MDIERFDVDDDDDDEVDVSKISDSFDMDDDDDIDDESADSFEDKNDNDDDDIDTKPHLDDIFKVDSDDDSDDFENSDEGINRFKIPDIDSYKQEDVNLHDEGTDDDESHRDADFKDLGQENSDDTFNVDDFRASMEQQIHDEYAKRSNIERENREEEEVQTRPRMRRHSDRESANSRENVESADSSFISKKKYQEQMYAQAKECLKNKDYQSARYILNSLMNNLEEKEISRSIYTLASIAYSKTGELKKGLDYINKAIKGIESPKLYDIRAMIYLDKYISVARGNKLNKNGVKYLQKAEKNLAQAVKLAKKQKSRECAGIAYSLYAEMYYLYGRNKKAREYVNRSMDTSDSWCIAEKIDSKLRNKKRSGRKNVLTAIGFIVFGLLTAFCVFGLYVFNSYIVTELLLPLGIAMCILVLSTIGLTWIWGANTTTRKHGAIPIVIATVCNFLIWGAVIFLYIYENIM